MVLVIQMFYAADRALIIILTKTNPASISKAGFSRFGMIAIVAVRRDRTDGDHVRRAYVGNSGCWAKWSLVSVGLRIVLLLVSKFVSIRAAALKTIVPVALAAIGGRSAYIVASAGMLWLLYPADLYRRIWRRFSFDRSGTTTYWPGCRGRSFILPGFDWRRLLRLWLDLCNVRIPVMAALRPVMRGARLRLAHEVLNTFSYYWAGSTCRKRVYLSGAFPDGRGLKAGVLSAHLRLCRVSEFNGDAILSTR